MDLDLVLGMSCNDINNLACDRNSGLVAHTASGVLVILDTKTNCQVKYLRLRKNSVSSVDFSPDGKYIVTGEIGYRPAVRVWKVKDGQEVATLLGHEFGIKSVLFCPTMDEIVSVGLEHDNEVNIWAWPDKHRLATNKIVDVVKAVAYSECGTFFVTAGNRHLKFWYPKLTMAHARRTDLSIAQPLYGRPGILGDFKQHTFLDVVCGNARSSGFVYAIARAGGLSILNASDRRLVCYKTIKSYRGTCVKAHDQILFIGFSNGDIHMFDALTLICLAALPVSFFQSTGLNGGGVFTMAFNPHTTLLSAAYKNSSLCVWDLQDAKHVTQKYVAVYHSQAIASFDMFCTIQPESKLRETMVTVSHDGTVRLWGIVISKSICYDRLSILYTDSTPLTPEEREHTTLDNAGIITAVKVSPDLSHIVTGNKAGSICVYNRETYEHLLTVLAHNREVTCLAFYSDSFGRSVLVSGSRDRLIHVMDINNEFRLMTTLNIHSSSITAMTVCEVDDEVYLISCSSDRSLSICTTPIQDTTNAVKPPIFQLSRCATSVSSPADITVDLETKHLAVGCQDGYVRVLDMAILQERRMFRGCPSVEGQIHKINLDKECVLLLTAASDKTINVINFRTGDILTSVTGHTKCVTGLVFSSKGDHVISASMDSCVFIWRLGKKLVSKRKEICRYRDSKGYGKQTEEVDNADHAKRGTTSVKIGGSTQCETKNRRSPVHLRRSPKKLISTSELSGSPTRGPRRKRLDSPSVVGKPIGLKANVSHKSWPNVAYLNQEKRNDKNRSCSQHLSDSSLMSTSESSLEFLLLGKQENQIGTGKNALLVADKTTSMTKLVIKDKAEDIYQENKKTIEAMTLTPSWVTDNEKRDSLCSKMSLSSLDKFGISIHSDRAEDEQQRQAADDSMKNPSQVNRIVLSLLEDKISSDASLVSTDNQCIRENKFHTDRAMSNPSVTWQFIDDIRKEEVEKVNPTTGNNSKTSQESMTLNRKTILLPVCADNCGTTKSHNLRQVFMSGVTKTFGGVAAGYPVLTDGDHADINQIEKEGLVSDMTKCGVTQDRENVFVDSDEMTDDLSEDLFSDKTSEGSLSYCPCLSCSFPPSAQERSQWESQLKTSFWMSNGR